MKKIFKIGVFTAFVLFFGFLLPMKAQAIPYQMPVLSLRYFPLQSGTNNLDLAITGMNTDWNTVNTKVDNLQSQTVSALNDGSKYHGYRDPSAPPSLSYQIIDSKTYFVKLPQGAMVPEYFHPEYTSYRPDYMAILNNINICYYVDTLGVKEVWLWGYHTDPGIGGSPPYTEPVESNMSMGTISQAFWNMGSYGDVSNSERTNDMPTCNKTYYLYNYNYGRGLGEAMEDHGHQIEATYNFIDGFLFWGNFVSPYGSVTKTNHCGWTHMPPNTLKDYDWSSTTLRASNCRDWHPDGSGEVQQVNCYTWPPYTCPDDAGAAFKKWWMQNIPGYQNELTFEGANLKNWWDFIGDFDAAIAQGKSLSEAPPDIIPPTSTITAPSAYSWQNDDLNDDGNKNDPFFSVSITDQDNEGGTGLKNCGYHVLYLTAEYTVKYTKEFGLRTCNSSINISVGPGNDCQAEGYCQVIPFATDRSGNTPDWNTTRNQGRWFSIDWTNPAAPTSVSYSPNPNTTGTHTISWSGASDTGGSGIASYDIRRSSDGGSSWTTVATGAITTSWKQSPAVGTGTYIYQVETKDTATNMSSWSTNTNSVAVSICDSTSFTSCSTARDFGSGGNQTSMCGTDQYYKVTVPTGQTCDLTWTVTPSAGDYNLYVSWSNGACPSTEIYDCYSTNGGTTADTCARTGLAAGTYYALSRQLTAGRYSISASLSNCRIVTQIDCYFGENCIFDKTSLTLGESVGVGGWLKNLSGQGIGGKPLELRKSNGTWVTWLGSDENDAKTDANGYKTYSWTPSSTGAESYYVRFKGDTTYAESLAVNYLTVNPPQCSGPVSLSLFPSPVVRNGEVTPSASNLSNCQNKQVIFKDSSLSQVSNCTIGSDGLGCTGAAFTVPSSQGNYTYYAYIDINGNGNYLNIGDSSSAALQVTYGICFPAGTNCAVGCSGIRPPYAPNNCRGAGFITGYCGVCSTAGCSWCPSPLNTACFCLDKADPGNYNFCGKSGADTGFKSPIIDNYTAGNQQFSLSSYVLDSSDANTSGDNGAVRYWYHETGVDISGNQYQYEKVDDKISGVCSAGVLCGPANIEIRNTWKYASSDILTISTKLEYYCAANTFDVGFDFSAEKYSIPGGESCLIGMKKITAITGINNSNAGTIKSKSADSYQTQINLEYCGDGETNCGEACDASNPSDPNKAICRADCTLPPDTTPPTTSLSVKRKSTGEIVTGGWLRPGTYTIEFTDSDNVGGSDLMSYPNGCKYHIIKKDDSGVYSIPIVSFDTPRNCNASIEITLGVSPYDKDGFARYWIMSTVKDNAGLTSPNEKYLHCDYIAPQTQIK